MAIQLRSGLLFPIFYLLKSFLFSIFSEYFVKSLVKGLSELHLAIIWLQCRCLVVLVWKLILKLELGDVVRG